MFDILEKLGEGAFGAVYSAKLKETGFVLAVKEVVLTKAGDRASIEKEINMLRQCVHKSIVQYYGTEGDNIYNEISGREKLIFILYRLL